MGTRPVFGAPAATTPSTPAVVTSSAPPRPATAPPPFQRPSPPPRPVASAPSVPPPVRPTAVTPSVPRAAPGESAVQLWQRVLEVVRQRPAMSWVAGLTLRGMEGNTATVAPTPGRRDLARFVTPQRAEQVAQVFSQVAGRPIRVEVEPTADDPAAPASPGGQGAPGAGANPASPGSQWQTAMALPLVRQVVEMFDATLVEVRDGAAPPAPTSGGSIPPLDGDIPLGDAADQALFDARALPREDPTDDTGMDADSE